EVRVGRTHLGRLVGTRPGLQLRQREVFFMAGQVMASPQWSDRFRAFFERHPDFDLMRFDFWHRTHRRALVVAEGEEGHGTIEQLAAYQCLLRVCHDTSL